MTRQKTPPSVTVTRPSLPPLEALVPHLEKIWASRVVTSGGAYHQALEERLSAYLAVDHLALFNNATVALLAAIKALDLQGEVITTPYSFVATAHVLQWSGLSPVFVDIDPKTLNLDPQGIEAAITDQTSAIMPVHVYGTPCDVDAIEAIARRHGLKVIYDAAHAFGVRCHCGSLLRHGDLSVVSFHATKVFNTFEGGAIVCPDAKTKRRIDRLKNFGFENEVTVTQTGINGKMSEFNAALGLVQLDYIDQHISQRGERVRAYREGLANIEGLTCLPEFDVIQPNHSYFPIFVDETYPVSRDHIYHCLQQHGFYGRRYFYPLISDFPMYAHLPSAASGHLPHASRVASQVICLPLYPDLDMAAIDAMMAILSDPLAYPSPS